MQPNWLYKNTERYATYDRKGPKVFVGEFAAHDEGRRNNLRCALAEAAYMTGLVRHSDVVVMASYAPLLSRYGHSQWQPNLVWFDNHRVVRTPSYHVQAMFAQNRPDVVLPMKVELAQRTPQPQGMIGVGTWNTQAEYRNIQVTDPNGKTLFESDFSQDRVDLEAAGWETAGGSWSVVDGALRQTAGGPNVRAVAGDPAWSDYTLTLQAKKLGGNEGFLILFHSPNAESPTWWNIGGWGNTAHAIQGGDFTEHRLPGSVETGRWYDIRIDAARRQGSGVSRRPVGADGRDRAAAESVCGRRTRRRKWRVGDRTREPACRALRHTHSLDGRQRRRDCTSHDA